MQEATVVIRNIFRKYPNRYESIISTLCENLDSLDESEAKAAMIWVIGQYADRIDNSDVLLDDFLYSFADETVEVQLALITATVKLFIQRPTKGQDLVVKVLKWATEETDNPDLRDRGYMYWRLLSHEPATAKKVVMGEKPSVTAESEKLDAATLEEMCLAVGTLATVYLKPIQQVFRTARPRKLADSPALQKHKLPSYIAHEAQKSLPSVHGDGLSPSLKVNGHGISNTNNGTVVGNGNGNGNITPNLAAAVDAADVYFSSLGSQQLHNMNIGDDDGGGFGSSPPVVGAGASAVSAGERTYVVNQNHPDRVFQPQVGGEGNGDLLL